MGVEMSGGWVEEQVGSAEVEFCDLVTIRKFQDLLDASLAKSGLESAGMGCYLKDEYTIGHVVHVGLQVRRTDVEAAKEILDQPIPENFEVEGVGSFQQPRCPVCGSLDVDSEELLESRHPLTILMRSPQKPTAWKCRACPHQWIDDNAGA
jgi:hypothetical protein